jgi:AraC-like DNA-binding protein
MPESPPAIPVRTAPPGWTRQALPAELGECHAERFTLGDGLVLARSLYHPLRDLAEESVNADAARTLVITLGLSGESGYVERSGATLRFGANHTTLAAFSGSHGERRYAAGQPVRQLRLLVSGEALDRYVGPELSRRLTQVQGVRQLDYRRSTPASLACARRLAQPSPGRATDALDLHIAMLSLAALELRHIAPEPVCAPRHSDDDLARLERARDLLAAQMDRELTLSYLAGAVGLNEFKLKQGFREVFGTSPHRMLLELRMRRAWALLETGCQVAQAGYQVGYAHPANFSAAFSRFFGRTPKSVFGRRS